DAAARAGPLIPAQFVDLRGDRQILEVGQRPPYPAPLHPPPLARGLILSCVQKDTNIHSFPKDLEGGNDATSSIDTGRFGGTLRGGLAGSPEQGRISTGTVCMAAGGAGTERQPGGPSLGLAADLGPAAAGAVLAAGRRVLGAPGTRGATPSEPDPGRRDQ